ncbi:MAG: hypothetical protein AAF662_07945 [Pseudomonadota bacterium]
MERRKYAYELMLVVLLAQLAATGSAGGETAAEAKAAFLEHIESNAPVCGDFVLVGKTDEEFAARRAVQIREDAERRGLKVKLQPKETRLHCRWATDAAIELLEPTEGVGGNIWRAFYKSRESLLDGNNRMNYNLMDARDPSPVRPGSFYNYFGPQSWGELLRVGRLVDEGKLGSLRGPEYFKGASAFGFVSSGNEFYVYTAVESGWMVGAEWYIRDKLMRRLKIDSYEASDDGRVFPKSAVIDIYGGQLNPIRTIQLEARNVRFPSTKGETDACLRMVIPAGSEIFDTALKRKASLLVPTEARSILEDKVPFLDLDSVTFDPLTTDASSGLWLRRFVLGINLILVMVLAVFWLTRKRTIDS